MIKRRLKTVLKLPAKIVRRYRVKKTVSRLKAHESPILMAVGCALHESLADTTSVKEQELIALIEKRRSLLLNSDKEISIVDYGAGSPDSNRAKEEMEAGVKSTALVSTICKASKSAFWAILLFRLIRKIEPLSCLELGSCVGISASYQATALRMNGKGALVTLEGSPETAKIAQETLEGLNLKNASVVVGPFHQTFKGVLKSSKPIDFFFNDGHHDHDAVIHYFNEAIPYLSEGAIIVFDDISWSSGMRRAWHAIENDNRVAASIDLQTMGIALIRKNLAIKEKFRIPL